MKIIERKNKKVIVEFHEEEFEEYVKVLRLCSESILISQNQLTRMLEFLRDKRSLEDTWFFGQVEEKKE